MGRNAQLALDPRRAQQHAFLAFQSIGQVDDVAAGLARQLPGIAGEGLVRGEEREVHVLQVLGQNALDKGGLIADGLELAQRLFVIQQANIVRPGNCGR